MFAGIGGFRSGLSHYGDFFVPVGYPGDWDGTVERVEVIGDLFITVTKVYPQDRSVYFHVVSFIRTANDKIVSIDEYWADDGNPPQWRIDKHIGKPII